MAAALHLEKSTDVKPMQKHQHLVPVAISCCHTVEVVNKFAVFTGFGERDRTEKVFGKAADDIVGASKRRFALESCFSAHLS